MINDPPENPKIYHIVTFNSLASIINDGFIFSDMEMRKRDNKGTTIGMSHIKDRRLVKELNSYPDLTVGACVPFYFCYRSIMLYLLFRGNHPDITFKGTQEDIIHLESSLLETVKWAKQNSKRWVFTTTNAGTYFFEDYNKLKDLDKLNWNAINSIQWSGPGINTSIKEHKQAEFLIEEHFPWQLVSSIGVLNNNAYNKIHRILNRAHYKPPLYVKPDWYY